MDDVTEDQDNANYTYLYYRLSDLIILSIAIFICIFGVVGNGLVMWWLSIHITSNSFTTYILNLAVTDLGTLVFLTVYLILSLVNHFHGILFYMFSSAIQLRNLIHFTYTASLCFLTVLSAETCLSLLFPVCYQRHSRDGSLPCYLFVNFYVLPSLLGSFILVLLAKICCNSQQQSPGTLNLVLLLSLLCILVLRGPWTVAFSLQGYRHLRTLLVFSQLIHSVNSSTKPVFYYLVGKRLKWSSREPLKMVLQRAFWEGTPSGDELTARKASGVASY
ncbi:mas-related G-protein coupled receptor member H-like [Python bivittatus]|uniref:Mas-related G-protein coupled receptor member H-like n=1 Tax=Python bivittatus TaxID=176946 RepID=A0A9F5J5S1_PYTBI|nr:mas-related G-protein coupled receptor member H-like [Python bivittatus]